MAVLTAECGQKKTRVFGILGAILYMKFGKGGVSRSIFVGWA
jgi:hypothetical protein